MHSLEGVPNSKYFWSEKYPAVIKFLEIAPKKVHFNIVILTETKLFLGNFPEIFKESNSRTFIGFYH